LSWGNRRMMLFLALPDDGDSEFFGELRDPLDKGDPE